MDSTLQRHKMENEFKMKMFAFVHYAIVNLMVWSLDAMRARISRFYIHSFHSNHKYYTYICVINRQHGHCMVERRFILLYFYIYMYTYALYVQCKA